MSTESTFLLSASLFVVVWVSYFFIPKKYKNKPLFKYQRYNK
jgi:hypothetical protein